MATEKKLNTRVTQKIDTTENWSKATFPPMKGEIIVYQDGDKNRIKIGDGSTPVGSLPYVNEITSLSNGKVEKVNVEEYTLYDNMDWGSGSQEYSNYYSSGVEFTCEFSNGVDPAIKVGPFEPINEDGMIIQATAYLPIYGMWWGEEGNDDIVAFTITISEIGEIKVKEASGNDCGVVYDDYCKHLTLTLYTEQASVKETQVNSIKAGNNISLENNNGELTITSKSGGTNYTAGNGINISEDNTISAKLAHVRAEGIDDTYVPTATSVRDELVSKIEGFSTKFTVKEKGWHRVLNTIRGNAGQLYITITDGYTLQSLTIDVSGFVQFGDGRTPEEAGYVFCKSNSSYLGPKLLTAQSDPYYKYKITQVRMGYPDAEARKIKFDPEVSAGTSINCYVDVYIDYNATVASEQDAQILLQFTGKSYQHNCYPIEEEVTDNNYTVQIENNFFSEGDSITLTQGMYGETLDFINVPIREDYDIVEEGYKEKLVDNFKFKVSDNNGITSSLVEAHNIKDISSIEFTTTTQGGIDFDTTIIPDFRLYRKYNLLPLFSVSGTNDMFSRYDWTNATTIGSKYRGGNIILPYKSGKKTTNGVRYNVTKSGTIIFNGTPTANNYMNVYYSNNANSAIVLPAGKYITNVYDVYYTKNISNTTETHITFNNFIGSYSSPQIKGFVVDSPVYLTFARLRFTTSTWENDSSMGEFATYTPFLIKVDDSIEMTKNSAGYYNITDSRFNGFNIRSNLGYHNSGSDELNITDDGWLELVNKDNDYIIINDTLNNEYHEINHFNEFYSSWRAKGKYDVIYQDPDVSHIESINFNTNKTKVICYDDNVDLVYKDFGSKDDLLHTYNMYVDKSENPYDTLFMLYELNPIQGTIKHNEIVDVKEMYRELQELKKNQISITTPQELTLEQQTQLIENLGLANYIQNAVRTGLNTIAEEGTW